ncbi:hypothetical protein [Chitinophaga filiformis]|uniref:Uncharacterized protein n=1 Tax=Chitinophaga filiformis TaxID=104663 RepID=A0ABY4HYG1_CHIFI|nr:hypothetical protein [Chitinophaga filiformis]UPK67973.1 hypothetical protein MYF79_23760 [Chitinophaga filiformis]
MRTFIFALIVTCFCVVNFSYGQTNSQRLKKVVIEYEEFTTTTGENVTCEAFRPTFKETLHTIVLEDSELPKLNLYRRKFVATARRSMDVRAVIRFEFEHKGVEYCTDISGVFFNKKEGKFYKNKELFDVVKKKCLIDN